MNTELLKQFDDDAHDDIASAKVKLNNHQPDNITTDWLRKSADLLREVELNFETGKLFKKSREECHDKIKLAKAYIQLAEGYHRAGLKW
jgi:hypothetical protein